MAQVLLKLVEVAGTRAIKGHIWQRENSSSPALGQQVPGKRCSGQQAQQGLRHGVCEVWSMRGVVLKPCPHQKQQEAAIFLSQNLVRAEGLGGGGES